MRGQKQNGESSDVVPFVRANGEAERSNNQLDQAGHYVMVVGPDKKVEQRRITTGIEQGRDIVVTQGLKEGELVIIEGIQKVHPGLVVATNLAAQN